MEPISAWAVTAQPDLENGSLLIQKQLSDYEFKVIATTNSLFITARWAKGGSMAFRPVFAANDTLQEAGLVDGDGIITLSLKGLTGLYKVTLQFPVSQNKVFHYTTVFTPACNMLVPYCPRDILPLAKQGNLQNTAGKIHAYQQGARSGLLFFSFTRPVTGSVFYFQDLTSLAAYCEDTETSAGDLVGGSWPEIGFKLPVTEKNKPLIAGKEYTISDAYVLLSTDIPKDDFEITQQFLNYLAEVYTLIAKPDTQYHNWPDMLHKGLNDIQMHKGCWAFAAGRSYLNAYVSDYDTPPEVMVQLAVLLPLVDFDGWSGEEHHPLIETLKEGVANFYDERLKTIVRWLPKLEDKMQKLEEQKQPGVMDSWYLHHPLMNLSRLALNGDKEAAKMLLNSIDYAINVAHHFNYEWPVFYKMDTLEVIKEETDKGKGGEKDVPGAYAHLMIQVWQLTGESRYLNEAKRAAKNLKGLGFDLFYQANNTAFTAGALMRLYKETNDVLYLNLSYVCIAAILKNVQLWDCNYGYGKYYTTFFGVFPLANAPYTAAYEEQEVFAGVHNYLREANGVDLLPSIQMLLAEFIKYAIHRLPYYYPPMLPKEMLSDEVKTGEIDPNLWVALEDLQDGWQKSGTVGQEVYGAGIAFGIVPRQYFKFKKAGMMIFTDYPTEGFRETANAITFYIKGDGRLSCRMMVMPLDKNKKLPKIIATSGTGKEEQTLKLITTKEGHKAYTVNGGSFIKVSY